MAHRLLDCHDVDTARGEQRAEGVAQVVEAQRRLKQSSAAAWLASGTC
jgi:hypothetical protein